MIYTIRNDKTEVKINSLGAEVRSVIHNGKQRAWQNETGEWSGCAILLFPFAGFNRLVYDGVDFGIQKHGFCRNEEFILISQAENSIVFELCANDRTRAVYPYEFAFRVKYELLRMVMKFHTRSKIQAIKKFHLLVVDTSRLF